MDHGILNVPLEKRGNKLFGVSRAEHERQVKAQEKKEAAEHRELIANAKAHLETLSDERIAELAVTFNKTVNQTRKYLGSEARWNPQLVLNLKAG